MSVYIFIFCFFVFLLVAYMIPYWILIHLKAKPFSVKNDKNFLSNFEHWRFLFRATKVEIYASRSSCENILIFRKGISKICIVISERMFLNLDKESVPGVIVNLLLAMNGQKFYYDSFLVFIFFLTKKFIIFFNKNTRRENSKLEVQDLFFAIFLYPWIQFLIYPLVLFNNTIKDDQRLKKILDEYHYFFSFMLKLEKTSAGSWQEELIFAPIALFKRRFQRHPIERFAYPSLYERILLLSQDTE